MQLLVLVLFYFELHSQLGNYDTIRTPKQGRDFDYRYSSYDLYLVGATNEIYRFNLKQEKIFFSNGFNACQFNLEHELFACGSVENVMILMYDLSLDKLIVLFLQIVIVVADITTFVYKRVKNLTSIEPGTPLNHMLNIPGTGTICLTNTLGNAPKWCTFLDNITEEFEEKPADTVYNDYKFLTLN
ncbi:unnamed protein product [Rotaria socialis]|uniref:Uncharacterized protein n=1 Tax=Rotaria socialis TaxID=392032 RepID=A0A821MQ04_9BILA|nr:unnamed protein product [Rotaria socialis]CAF4729321.1 unnamed protein product [Rotaria socialis]CAF4771849.1 unnamed protein product [Rotaria socialis]